MYKQWMNSMQYLFQSHENELNEDSEVLQHLYSNREATVFESYNRDFSMEKLARELSPTEEVLGQKLSKKAESGSENLRASFLLLVLSLFCFYFMQIC